MGVLSIFAICGMAWGIVASNNARIQTKNAKQLEKNANDAKEKSEIISRELALLQKDLETANARSSAILGEVGQSDRAIARYFWNLKCPRDALAHWGRSLEYAPQSAVELDPIVSRISGNTWP